MEERQYENVAGEIRPNPMYWVPNKVVLDFFQHWGQPLEQRVAALNEAIELASFKETRAKVNETGETGWSVFGPESEETLFKQFYEELKSCFPKGKVEWEIDAVRQVIKKYQELNKQK